MSKLLDLLAQQKAIVEQIKKLEADENEAKGISEQAFSYARIPATPDPSRP